MSWPVTTHLVVKCCTGSVHLIVAHEHEHPYLPFLTLLFVSSVASREHVNQKHAVICACIVAAYRQVSTEELRRQFSLQESRRRGGKAFGEDHEVSLTLERIELNVCT